MKPRSVDIRCPQDCDDGTHVRATLTIPADARAAERWRSLNTALRQCSCGAATVFHVRAARHCRHCGSAEHNAARCAQDPHRPWRAA